MKSKLTGQDLANTYAAAHPLSDANPGKVWAHYEGGGWITLRGESLEPHPDLKDMYPNGWSLLSRTRSGKARSEMHDKFSALRHKYASAKSNRITP